MGSGFVLALRGVQDAPGCIGLEGVENDRHRSGLSGSGIGDIGEVNLARYDPGELAVKSAYADNGRRRMLLYCDAVVEITVAGPSALGVIRELVGLIGGRGR